MRVINKLSRMKSANQSSQSSGLFGRRQIGYPKALAVGFALLVHLAMADALAAGPTFAVYDDDFLDGWSSKPWGATVSSSSERAFRGTKSAKVRFSEGMGVFKAVAGGGFNTKGYSSLNFAIYNSSDADDLWLVAENSTGSTGKYLRLSSYSDLPSINKSRWTWFRVPIHDLGLGVAPKLAYFSIASGKRGAVAYIDDVSFAASTYLYEGMESSMAPGVLLSLRDAALTIYRVTADNNRFIKVSTSRAEGGIRLQQRTGNVKSTDVSAISIRWAPGRLLMSRQYTAHLTDAAGNKLGSSIYLDGSFLPKTMPLSDHQWSLMSIPMSAFRVSSSQIGGIRISSNLTADEFFVDDVRLLMRMKWPLGAKSKRVSGYGYGEIWGSDFCPSDQTTRKLHTGIDYSDDAASDAPVYATARGVVKQVSTQTGWGKQVTIQHERGTTTSYLHLKDIAVSEGKEVFPGDLLGKTVWLESGSHLHFGFRLSDFDSVVSQVGALPAKNCVDWGKSLPNSPGNFVSAEGIDWADLP